MDNEDCYLQMESQMGLTDCHFQAKAPNKQYAKLNTLYVISVNDLIRNLGDVMTFELYGKHSCIAQKKCQYWCMA